MSYLSTPAISIVVPVFNAERYLAECLDSLLSQSFQDIEVICVDNESTDGSLALLEEYAGRDQRIRVESCSGNAGSARNRGLSKARGGYLLFLDSDDFFARDMLQKLFDESQRSNADIILFGGKRFDDRSMVVLDQFDFLHPSLLPDKEVFSPADASNDLFQLTNPAPWARMYRRELIEKNNIRFQELANTNDWAFTYTAMMLAESIVAMEEDFVRYRTNVATSIQGRKREAPLCCIEAIYAVHSRLVQSGRYNMLRKSFEHQALSLLEFIIASVGDADARSMLFDEIESPRFVALGLFGKEPEEYRSSHTYEISRAIQGMIALNRKLYGERNPDGFALVAESSESSRNAKVSVIIPVFNTAEFIGEALDSIIGQTLPDIEVICIDDGSSDDSLSILEGYAKKDERIRVYSQVNSGLSKTRNNGMSVASGEYILFMDSDDALDVNALKGLYEKAVGESLDLCFFDAEPFCMEEDLALVCAGYEEYYRRGDEYGDVYDGPRLLVSMYEHGDYLPSACIYLMRRDFIEANGIAFHEGILHEDNAFTFECLVRAQRASHSNNAYYKRRVREGSITRMLSFEHVYGLFACYVDMMRTLSSIDRYAVDDDIYYGLLGIPTLTLNNAHLDYFALPVPQRELRFGLSDVEGLLFLNMIETPLDRENEERVRRLERERNELDERVRSFERSYSYRLGRAMLAPMRALRKLTKR